MFFKRLRKSLLVVVCLAAAGMLSGGPDALGQGKGKGGGGGGGGGNTGGGTIYFRWNGVLHQMNSDGSGKTLLPTPAGEPSRLLHGEGGRRWFLRPEAIAGESYPTGWARHEIFAYRDDGDIAVQLTDDPELELWGSPAWQPGDAGISWIARRWDLEAGEVVDAGIYAAELVFDEDGQVIGLAEQPLLPIIPAELIDAPTWGPGYQSQTDINSHDWWPDGTRIVFSLTSTRELWIADFLTEEFSLLYGGPAGGPRWSPDGSLIAFEEAVYRGDIMTIKPDGTDLKRIIRATGNSKAAEWVGKPSWSPTGSHLVYEVWSHDGFYASYADVYRAKADGSGKTNLTNESKTDFATPLGWR